MQFFLKLATAKDFFLIFYSPSLFQVFSSEIAMFQENRSWEREQDLYPDSFGHKGICLKPNEILLFLNNCFAIYQDDTLHALTLTAKQPCNALSDNTAAALACSASPGLWC